jgi:membrane protein
VAAGVAFYAMLALFPALIALVSVYGLISDPQQVQQQIQSISGVLPGDVAAIVQEQLSSIVSSTSAGLSLGFAISLAAALWTASSGIQALVTGVNIAYDEEETRNFLKLRGTALLFTLGAVVVVTLLLAGIVLVPVWVSAIGLGSVAETAINWGRWPLLAAVFFGALSGLYRYGADRSNPRWRWVTWGALASTVLWLLGSLGFSYYVSQFGNFNETYGALGAVIVLLFWLYISAFIVLLGAELNSEMEHQTQIDSTDLPEKPLGERRAYVADTVGKTAPHLRRQRDREEREQAQAPYEQGHRARHPHDEHEEFPHDEHEPPPPEARH